MRHRIIVFLFASLVSVASWACEKPRVDCQPREPKPVPTIAELEGRIHTEHPYTFCELSMAQLRAGNNEQALKHFYVCQLRWRIYLKTDGDPTTEGETAAFGAINYQLQPVIGKIGRMDPVQWSEQVFAAIDWHNANPSAFQDTAKNPEVEKEEINGLRKLGDEILTLEIE